MVAAARYSGHATRAMFPPSSEAPGDPVWPWEVVLAIGGVALFLLLAALSVAVVRRWRQRGKHVL